MVMLAIAAGCRTVPPAAPPGDALWKALQPLCGKAFAGRLVEGTERSNAELGRQRLVMHVRQCSESEIRIPFHVGENRSRTWVLTRTAGGVRLKHDHRHEMHSVLDGRCPFVAKSRHSIVPRATWPAHRHGEVAVSDTEHVV